MKNKGKILIVDDNAEWLTGLKLFLTPHAEQVVTLKNPNLIPEYLRKEPWDVVLLDMNFSAGLNTGNEGLYWMHRIAEMQPAVSVILITAYGDVELAVKAMTIVLGHFGIGMSAEQIGALVDAIVAVLNATGVMKKKGK